MKKKNHFKVVVQVFTRLIQLPQIKSKYEENMGLQKCHYRLDLISQQ